jgi:hypothetical protein
MASRQRWFDQKPPVQASSKIAKERTANEMTLKRLALAFLLASAGYGLTALAYDKPQWYFEVSGIGGAALFLGAIGWWLLPVFRRSRKE